MTLWLGKDPSILASRSQARQTLLADAGIPFEAVPAEIDERALQQTAGLLAADTIASHLASAKALSVSAQRPGRFVIGADQTLGLGDRLFTKPDGYAQAKEQLRALAGRSHQLHSAVAVARDGAVLFEATAVAHMTMRPLGEAEIDAYLAEAGAAVMGSVGAYQFEALGVHLFECIEGDHFTILGLPLLQLIAFLRGERLLAL